jgi:hypothetical protein
MNAPKARRPTRCALERPPRQRYGFALASGARRPPTGRPRVRPCGGVLGRYGRSHTARRGTAHETPYGEDEPLGALGPVWRTSAVVPVPTRTRR